MNTPPLSAIILVVVVPSRRDLEIARILGWYRIPLRFAPKFVDVDYLAFYQPASFGQEHQGLIENVAAVRGNELTTRKELFREEPDHSRANEEYYKIQLGPLEKLETPIRAGKWKRLTFLYTLGEVFNGARSIDDLVLKSDDRQLLWQSVKERNEHGKAYSQEQGLTDFEIDQALLALLGDWGKIAEAPEEYPE
jgi:hypothetical protein